MKEIWMLLFGESKTFLRLFLKTIAVILIGKVWSVVVDAVTAAQASEEDGSDKFKFAYDYIKERFPELKDYVIHTAIQIAVTIFKELEWNKK